MDSGFFSSADAVAAPVTGGEAVPADDGALAPRVPWAALLGATIQSEILPRLLTVHRTGLGQAPAGGEVPDAADVASFVALIIADDVEAARGMADRVIVQCGGRDALLDGLLAPAARLLGEMWERDTADFLTVTLGVYRLDQIMKETATAGFSALALGGHDHRILLLPAPGEPHSFGLSMVADAFREGGWCVRSGPAVARPKLLQLVREEWFDVVGLSVSADRHLRGLAACVRAVRAASCNPSVYVMLGGRAIMANQEGARFLGADATAVTAQDALRDANVYLETTVTKCLHQSKTRLVDIG